MLRRLSLEYEYKNRLFSDSDSPISISVSSNRPTFASAIAAIACSRSSGLDSPRSVLSDQRIYVRGVLNLLVTISTNWYLRTSTSLIFLHTNTPMVTAIIADAKGISHCGKLGKIWATMSLVYPIKIMNRVIPVTLKEYPNARLANKFMFIMSYLMIAYATGIVYSPVKEEINGSILIP